MPRSDVAESRQNVLRRWRRTRWPQSNAAKSQQNVLWQQQRMRWPWSNATESRPNALRRRQKKRWPMRLMSDVARRRPLTLGVAMRWRQPPRWWLRRQSHNLLQRWRKWHRPHMRKRWQTRPTSDAGPPRRTKRWPTRLTSDVTTSRPNALRLRRQKRLPRISTTRTMTMLRGNLRHMPHPSSLVLTPSWPKSEPWMMVLETGLHLVTRSTPRRTTKPQLQRCHPPHPRQPCRQPLCRQPPTALLRIRMRSSLPWGGAFARSL